VCSSDLSRDGEYFLRYRVESGRLRVQFIEPLLVWTPPNFTEQDDVWFGIRFKRGDYERPLGYYVRRTNYLGADISAQYDAWNRIVPADQIQHRKVNVDRSCPRGIPDTYWVQQRLEQTLRNLKAMGMLIQVRAKIALIRKRVNALAGSVQPMLSAAAAMTVAGPGGQVRNVSEYPYGAILDTSDQAEYQFPSPNTDIDKMIPELQAELQATATSTGLADYMVSGNLGSQSYASAMTASGPVVKTFQQHQADMIAEDRQVAMRVLRTAAEAGRVDAELLDRVTLEMYGPSLAASDGVQEAQARQIERQQGVLSVGTWRQLRGYNVKREETNIKAEAKAQLEVQTIQGVAPGQNQDGVDGTGPRQRETPNTRPFTADQEGRQKQRASGATKEEDGGRAQESSHEPHAQDLPTEAELSMASVFITSDWLAKTQAEIMALPMGVGAPREWAMKGQYEPGVQGVRLGSVDGQEVWAVDATAMMIAHDTMDFVVAGNHMRWDWIPADKILLDWSYVPTDAWHDLLHEVIETRLMALGKWSYALAHKIANWFERAWLLVLRPELAALKTREA